jgi:hypothetical protein
MALNETNFLCRLKLDSNENNFVVFADEHVFERKHVVGSISRPDRKRDELSNCLRVLIIIFSRASRNEASRS